MHFTEEKEAEVKAWVVKRLEDMYVEKNIVFKLKTNLD